MASDEARDRFCADLTRRLQAVQDQRDTVVSRSGMDSLSEHWWPYPDSTHSSQFERHSRRPSMTHGSDPIPTRGSSYQLSRTVSASSLHLRRLSVQDVWHDHNQETMDVLKDEDESASPYRPATEHGFPQEFQQALQEAAQVQKQKKQRPCTNRSRSNLKMTKLLKAARKTTSYESFNSATFGKRVSVNPREEFRRRSSLLSMELCPDEILVEEDEDMDKDKAIERIEEIVRMSQEATAAASKIQSPGEDITRRDSGYDPMDCDGLPVISPVGHGSSLPMHNNEFFGREACVW